jgi:hypothetical protein
MPFIKIATTPAKSDRQSCCDVIEERENLIVQVLVPRLKTIRQPLLYFKIGTQLTIKEKSSETKERVVM